MITLLILMQILKLKGIEVGNGRLRQIEVSEGVTGEALLG